MGLDQNLVMKLPPSIYNPFDTNTKDIAYWRKDWDLQDYINCGNCESVTVTADFCNDILSNLDYIYRENDEYLEHTKKAFTKALKLISEGKEIYYEFWW